MILLRLPYHRQGDGDALPEDILALLENISPATMDRLLAPVRRGHGKLGLATTKPGAILRTRIPTSVPSRGENRPGFFESDTFANCGTSVS